MPYSLYDVSDPYMLFNNNICIYCTLSWSESLILSSSEFLRLNWPLHFHPGKSKRQYIVLFHLLYLIMSEHYPIYMSLDIVNIFTTMVIYWHIYLWISTFVIFEYLTRNRNVIYGSSIFNFLTTHQIGLKMNRCSFIFTYLPTLVTYL